MQVGIWLIVQFLLLFVVHELARRSGKRFLEMGYIVVPILLTPYWIAANPDFGWFEWGKLYTVVLTTCWLVNLRSSESQPRSLALFLLTLLFAANILEAVAVDLWTGELASVINAVCGILLIVSLPQTSTGIRRVGGHSDLAYGGLSRIWIVAFTFWNLTFLLINYPILLGHHVAVLGVPLLIGLHNPQLWLQSRLNLLGFDLMFLATFRPWVIPWLEINSVCEWDFHLLAAGVTFVASVLSGLNTKKRLAYALRRVATCQLVHRMT